MHAGFGWQQGVRDNPKRDFKTIDIGGLSEVRRVARKDKFIDFGDHAK